MGVEEKAASDLGRFRSGQRRQVRLSTETIIKASYLNEESFPLVVEPGVEHVNLVTWAAGHREFIEAQLLKHGALLFRNFNIDATSQFEQFTRTLSADLLNYKERAAPRTEVSRQIYTSTEYPAGQHIPLHHEMSYSHNWPTKLWFYCVQPAQQGGRTPIASDRKVFRLIDPKIKERFMRKKVMYVRNYGEMAGLDMPWQEVFQTRERAVVEAYCRQSHMEFEWMDNNRLRTRQIRQAVATHPKTNETVWFNHAHMFHVSNLEPQMRESLLAEFKDDDLPRNAFYGDGERIETSDLNEIRSIYRQAAIAFTWQKGDILMLDNFLVSHGREPFVGHRKILVALADLYTNADFC